MTHFGRQYEDKTYFDIVGECIDYIPMLLKREQDMNTQSEMIRQKLQTALDHNIHFANLMYNESADSSFMEERDSLATVFEEMPINFNYLGDLSEEADLDYLDAEGVNCDDPNRILFMTWCRGDQIHITLVIPVVENKESIRSKLDEAARKQMKNYHAPPLKGANI